MLLIKMLLVEEFEKLLFSKIILRVHGSCLCRVNIRIVLIFVNPNLTPIINVSTFANSNSTH